MSDIKAMVDRFLGWKLPKTFSPDCGISFDGRGKDARGYEKTWPVGTNLFTAVEATQMVEHMLAAEDDAPAVQGEALTLHACRKSEQALWEYPECDCAPTECAYEANIAARSAVQGEATERPGADLRAVPSAGGMRNEVEARCGRCL